MNAGRERPARLLAFHDQFTSVEFLAAGVALAVMLGSYLYEVVSRYGFDVPTRWSSDVVQYTLCVCVAMALPTVTRESGHVAITSFLEKLQPTRQALATRAIVWLGAATLLGTTLIFMQVALEQARLGVETVAALAIPKWWLTAVVGVGMLDSGFHLLRQALGWSKAAAGHEMDV